MTSQLRSRMASKLSGSSWLCSVQVCIDVFCLHEGQILFQDDPDVGVWSELAANCQLHVDSAAILVAHTLCQAWVLIVKVLVTMQRHIAQPSDFLSAHATEDLEVLIAHMDSDPQRLHLLQLAARKLA